MCTAGQSQQKCQIDFPNAQKWCADNRVISKTKGISEEQLKQKYKSFTISHWNVCNGFYTKSTNWTWPLSRTFKSIKVEVKQTLSNEQWYSIGRWVFNLNTSLKNKMQWPNSLLVLKAKATNSFVHLTFVTRFVFLLSNDKSERINYELHNDKNWYSVFFFHSM